MSFRPQDHGPVGVPSPSIKSGNGALRSEGDASRIPLQMGGSRRIFVGFGRISTENLVDYEIG